MFDNMCTFTGNLTEDPTLRFTQEGHPVTNVRIAVTERRYDKDAGEYVDGDTLFIGGSVWRKAAENVAESLSRGDRVTITGPLKQRSYTDKGDVERTVYEVDIKEIGPSLLRAEAKPEKNAPQNGGGKPAPKSAASKPAAKVSKPAKADPPSDEPDEDDESPF